MKPDMEGIVSIMLIVTDFSDEIIFFIKEKSINSPALL